MVEVGYHRVGQAEVVGREDKLVGPSLKLLQQAVCAHSRLSGFDHTCSNAAHMMALALRVVDDLAGFRRDEHLLRVHLVLRQVLYLNLVEIAQTAMKGDIGRIDASYLHHLEHLAREVDARAGCRDSALVFGERSLEVLHVLFGGMGKVLSFLFRTVVDDISGQWCLAQGEELYDMLKQAEEGL